MDSGVKYRSALEFAFIANTRKYHTSITIGELMTVVTRRIRNDGMSSSSTIGFGSYTFTIPSLPSGGITLVIALEAHVAVPSGDEILFEGQFQAYHGARTIRRIEYDETQIYLISKGHSII